MRDNGFVLIERIKAGYKKNRNKIYELNTNIKQIQCINDSIRRRA